VEEHSVIGGFGELTRSLLASSATKVTIVGTKDFFMAHVGSHRYAREQFGIDCQSIVRHAKKAICQAKC
jgi:transketolase C-terminal domain/subunit